MSAAVPQSPWQATETVSAASAEQPWQTTETDEWVPERLVIHKTIHDAAVALKWGILPGSAVCGFVFTTANHVGPARLVDRDPRFVTRPCPACDDWLTFANLLTPGGGS